jgi:hypothetical protein
MRGLIDEVLFYARPLAPEEIALLAEGVVPPDGDPRRADVSDAAMELHLRADRELKLDGTQVASWTDPARAITAASAAKDCFPSLSSTDGQPWLKFDGKKDCLDIPSRPALTFEEGDSFTLAIRVQFAAAPNGRWQGSSKRAWTRAPGTDSGSTIKAAGSSAQARIFTAPRQTRACRRSSPSRKAGRNGGFT